MNRRTQDLLDMLYAMVRDAWKLPLGNDKCVVEQEKVMDLLDEIKASLPGELEEAARLVDGRAEFIAAARREAEQMKKSAEEQAARMIDEQEIVRAANARASAMLAEAESKSRELRRVANEYADDALRRTEEAIGEAMEEVRSNRAKFRAVSAAVRKEEDAQ